VGDLVCDVRVKFHNVPLCYPTQQFRKSLKT
jgi:hypothetical protein